MNCPPMNELLDYARQALAPSDHERIAAHVATECRACAQNLEWLAKVTNSSAAHPSYEFSENTINGMVAWFRSQPAHESPSPLQLIARLLFDSFAQPQWAAARSANEDEALTERQMLFQTAGYDIDLRFEAADDSAHEDLIGQVLSQSAPSATGVTIELQQGQQASRNTAADGQGFFKFAQIPRGTYDLKIRVPEGEISIPQITTARAA